MFVLLVIAVVVAIQKVRGRKAVMGADGAALAPDQGALTTPYRFLLWFTVPLWGFYFVMNFWKRTEVNWPAASYFAGMILLAGVFVEGWNSTVEKDRKGWRVWGTIAVTWGFLMTMAAMNTQRFYPLVASKLAGKEGTPAYTKSPWHPGRWDQPTVRLRGLQDRAMIVEKARQAMVAETEREPLLITARYDTSSSLAFYMPGHPFVFSLMSSVGGRQSQYDVWPGLNQEVKGVGNGVKTFLGRDALIVGSFEPWAVEEVLKKSFDRVEGPEKFTTQFDGVALKDVYIYRAYGFRGVPGQAGSVY
jgi:hypothetical protein